MVESEGPKGDHKDEEYGQESDLQQVRELSWIAEPELFQTQPNSNSTTPN